VLVFAGPMLLAAALGTGLGVVYKRWGAPGMYALSTITVLAIGGLIVLTTWLGAWGSVGHFLVIQPIASLAVAIPVAVTAVVGAASFAGLRRVVP
jgi:hypothetical protein